MICLVWWILSLLNVCSFGALPVLIDSVIGTIIICILADKYGDRGYYGLWYLLYVGKGVCVFLFCKNFLNLELSYWWIFIAAIWGLISFVFPGGHILTNVLLIWCGVMDVPIWMWILSGIIDVFDLFIVIFSFCNVRFKK